MRDRKLSLLMLAAGAAAASPARAQPVAPPTPCELHVWPAYQFDARTQGLGAITGALGTLDDDNAHAVRNGSDKAMLSAYFGPDVQVATLKSIDLSRYLGVPVQTQYHGEISNDALAKTGVYAKTRSISSSAACYDELVLTFFSFDKSPLMSAVISFGVNIKTFDASSPKRRKDVFTIGKIKAKAFSDGTPLSAPGPARDQLVGDFKVQLEAALATLSRKLAK